MSKATLSIEGYVAEPKQRVSQNGKAMLDISVAHSPRRFNKQSNQWEDVTDQQGNKITLWIRATFFEDYAQLYAQHVTKGSYVRLEGEPRLNVYTDNGGNTNANIELQFAQLSIIPRRTANDQGGYQQAQQQWSQPAAQPASSGFDGGEVPF